jgi:hypothetical protein
LRFAFDFSLECVQRVVPEAVQPSSQFGDTAWIDRIETSRADGLVPYQAGVLEHLEVLRDGGPADGKPRGDDAHRCRSSTQSLEYGAAGRVGESGES